MNIRQSYARPSARPMAPRCPEPTAHRSAHPWGLHIARSQPERRSHTDRSPPHWQREIPHLPGEAAGPADSAQAHANRRAGSSRCPSRPRPSSRRPGPRPPRSAGGLPGPAPDAESSPRPSTRSPSTPIMSAHQIARHDDLLSPSAAAADPLIDPRPTSTPAIKHNATGIDDTITAAGRSAIRAMHVVSPTLQRLRDWSRRGQRRWPALRGCGPRSRGC